jgi:RimJ/RimL family protein N-acetyltransferase
MLLHCVVVYSRQGERLQVIDLLRLWEERTTGPKRMADLRAGRLLLVAITPEMLMAEQEPNVRELARLLRARVTPQWPPEHWEPHVYRFILKQYEERPETFGWHRYLLVTNWLGLGRTLVGALGAFPKAKGDIEIGYSTLPEFQRRGYATASARLMVEWLLAREGICSVSAQSYSRTPESIKVMERCGMSFVGVGDEPDTVRYRRTRAALTSPQQAS